MGLFVLLGATFLTILALIPGGNALELFRGFIDGNQSEYRQATSPTVSNPTSNTGVARANNLRLLNDDSFYHAGYLELPVAGATGWAATATSLVRSGTDEVIAVLSAGTAFRILEEEDAWWYIERATGSGGETGWVQHTYCMINLPDVVPSIIYDNTNAYSSAFISSGENIPGITGARLYSFSDRSDGRSFNARLQRYEYIVPVLYSTAKRVSQAQRNALENGDTLIMYEAFRPASVQTQVADALSAFANANSDIRTGISTPPWSIGWFISTGISNHQRGYAVDIGLARVIAVEEAEIGGYRYRRITQFEIYEMPSPIHELSIRSITTVGPASSELSESIKNNPYALALRHYAMDAGLTPLPSEWWHFDDLHTAQNITEMGGNGNFRGNFEIRYILSVPPG